MGGPDQRLRKLLQDDLFHSPLVAAIGVGMQETHRDGPDPPPSQDARHRPGLPLVERGTHFTGAECSLGDFQAVPGPDDRGARRLVVDVPDVLFGTARGLGQDGGNAPGGHHCHPREASLYQSVGAQGRSVSEGAESIPGHLRFIHGIEDSPEPIGSGGSLDDLHFTFGVGHHPVGERPSDVDPDSELSHQIPR